jgi:transaldolase
MSVATEVNERLARITELGTSIWLDQIRLNLIECGELQRLVKFESLRGVTSNPAIFEKAILGSDDYDELIEEAAREGLDTRSIYERLAVETVRAACDVLRPVYDESDGADGFVSIEVEPDIAFDTPKTIESARHYWQAVDRPNVMIKIPGTDEGAKAVERATAAGINVNITLLFSIDAYAKVIEAYMRGLEERVKAGKDISSIHSVASFFVSRVDTEVDKRLGTNDALKGRAAIANAKLAYALFQRQIATPRWTALAAKGGSVQRPLWASTSTKNPAYRDVMYVEQLIGPETVNTMPPATIDAFRDHGETARTVDQDLDKARADIAAIESAGINMKDVTDKLLSDGLASFQKSFETLLAGLEKKTKALGRQLVASR